MTEQNVAYCLRRADGSLADPWIATPGYTLSPDEPNVVKLYTRPETPDMALLVSMATCLNHGFMMLEWRQQNSMLHDMKKLWDEMNGLGYYNESRRGYYLGMLKPQPEATAYNEDQP